MIHDAGAVAVRIARQISRGSLLAAKGGLCTGTGDAMYRGRRPIKELAAWKWCESRLCSESPGFRSLCRGTMGTGCEATRRLAAGACTVYGCM